MFYRVCISAQRLLAAISQHRSPSQIAWGLAIGLSFGMIPMDNASSALLFLIVLFLPVNQTAAVIGFACSAMIGSPAAQVSTWIGEWVLSQSVVLNLLSVLYQFPVVAWFRLNNTLVMGGIVMGVCTVLPVYSFARMIVIRSQRILAEQSVKAMAEQASSYRKSMAEQNRIRNVLSEPVTGDVLRESSSSSVATAVTRNQSQTSTNVSLLDGNTNRLKSNSVAAQSATTSSQSSSSSTSPSASSLVSAAGEQPTISEQSLPTLAPRIGLIPMLRTRVDEVSPNAKETVLRETIIEVVRYRLPRPIASAKSADAIATNVDATLNQGNAMLVVDKPTTTIDVPRASHLPAVQTVQAAKASEVGTSTKVDPAMIESNRPTDSLRYLLRHLNGNRDSKRTSEPTA